MDFLKPLPVERSPLVVGQCDRQEVLATQRIWGEISTEAAGSTDHRPMLLEDIAIRRIALNAAEVHSSSRLSSKFHDAMRCSLSSSS